MSSVDNRVVQMSFENSKFEKNAATTLSTLEKLKRALDFSGATKGLENLSSSAKSVSMDALAAGVETVSNNFSSLEVVGIRVLQRITDMAFDAGRNLVTALTIDPVKSGLQEYETQINAVQTILSNTRDSLKNDEGLTEESQQIARINTVLDDLNKYADMTIYNFTEMTRNIGTFTAAGVQLDKAQSAIKGIANLAASSGSDSTQASRAMYQLSQALAAGTVHLQDWNSVVNAGMGGELFQKAIIDTARVHGVAIDSMIDQAGSFRATLNAQDWGDWLNADILLESLEKFTAGSEGFTHEQIEQQKALWKSRGYSDKQIQDLAANMKELTQEEYDNARALWASRGYTEEQIDEIMELGRSATDAATKVKTFTQLLETVGEALQSGWTQSWEYIVGDFADAKAFWTEISDIMNLYIGKSADARNEQLKFWALGPTDEFGNRLSKDLSGREMLIQGLRNAFQGVYEIVGTLNDAWGKSFLHKGLDDDISITGQKLTDLSKKFMDFTQSFKDAIVQDGKPTKLTEELLEIFNKTFGSLRKVYDGFTQLIKLLSTKIAKNGFVAFIDRFELLSSKGFLLDYLDKIADRFKNFADVLSNKIFTDNALITFFDGLANAVKALIKIKMDVAISAWDALNKIFSHATNDWAGVSDVISNIGIELGKFGDNVQKLIYDNDGVSRFNEVFQKVADNITNFIDSVKNVDGISFNAFNDWIQDLYDLMDKEPNKFFDILSDALESLANIGETLYAVFEPMIEAFLEVFKPSDIINGLSDIIDKFKDFTEAIKINGDNMVGLEKFYKGILDVVKALGKILSDVGGSLVDTAIDIFNAILPDKKSFTDKLGEIGEALSRFADQLNTLFEGGTDSNPIVSIIQTFSDSITNLIDTAQKLVDIPGLVQKFIDFINSIDFSGASKALDDFSNGIRDTKDASKDAEESSSIWEAVGKAVKSIVDLVKDIFTTVDIPGILGSIAAIMSGKAMMDFGNFLTDLPETLQNIKESSSTIPKILGTLKDCLEDLQSTINVAKIVAIAGAVAAIALSIAKLCEIPTPNIIGALTALSGGMAIFLGTIQILIKRVKITDLEVTWQMVGLLYGIAQAFNALSGSIEKIGSMNPEQVAQGLMGIAGIATIIVGFLDNLPETKDLSLDATGLILLGAAINVFVAAVKTMGDMKPEALIGGLAGLMSLLGTIVITLEKLPRPDKLLETSAALIVFGVAVNIFVAAVKTMGDMKPEALIGGLAGLMSLLGTIVITLEKLPRPDKLLETSAALIVFGVAVNIFVAAVKTMGGMKPEALIGGLTGLMSLLGTIVITLEKLPRPDKLLETSAALIVFGVAVNIFVAAVKTMGDMKPEALIGGLAGLMSLLGTIVITLEKLPRPDKLLETSAALIVFGVAVNIFVAAVKTMGGMKPEELVAGLGGLAAIFFMLIQILNGLPTPDKIIETSAGLVVMGVAINLMAAALKILSTIDPFAMITALGGLAGALLILSVAVKSFSTAMPGAMAMMAAGGAVLVIGAGMALLGTLNIGSLVIALAALAATFVVLGVAANALAPSIPALFGLAGAIAVLGIGVAAIVLSLSALGQMLITLGTQGAAAITALLDILIQTIPKVGELVSTFITTILQVFIDSIPKFTEFIIQVMTASFDTVNALMPKIGEFLTTLITTIVHTICEIAKQVIPEIAQTILQLLVDLGNLILEYGPQLLDIGIQILFQFLEGLSRNMGQLAVLGVDIILNFLDGINSKMKDIIDTAYSMTINFINGLADSIRENHNKLWDAIGNLITAIVEAIIDGCTKVANSAGELISSFLKEFDGQQLLDDLAGIGDYLVRGIISGLGGAGSALVTAAGDLARSALDELTRVFNEHSPSKEGEIRGKYLGEGVAIGISKSEKSVLSSAGSIAAGALDALKINNSIDSSPTITPVLDTSNIQNGIQNLNSMFSSMPSTVSIQGELQASAKVHSLDDIFSSLQKSRSEYSEMAQNFKRFQSDFAKYAEESANQAIIMDSGVLVGTLASHIDNELGFRQVLANRGAI